MSRMALSAAGLTAIYCLALASADPWDVAIGALLSLIVLVAFHPFLFVLPPRPVPELIARLAHLPRLMLATTANIINGTFAVARVVLTPGPVRGPGLVTIPIGKRTPSGVAMSGLLDTLSPGSVLIDVDPASGTWTIHALDATAPGEVIADVQEFYDRYQRQVWP
jgi:multisubunit Na+/H+ antiporter MnhE subunit